MSYLAVSHALLSWGGSDEGGKTRGVSEVVRYAPVFTRSRRAGVSEVGASHQNLQRFAAAGAAMAAALPRDKSVYYPLLQEECVVGLT